MPITAAQRRLYGRIGAHKVLARHDPRDLTAIARSRFLQRFEAEVRSEWPDLPDVEVERRALELRKAYMLQLAAKSSVARTKKKAAAGHKSATANGSNRDDSTTDLEAAL